MPLVQTRQSQAVAAAWLRDSNANYFGRTDNTNPTIKSECISHLKVNAAASRPELDRKDMVREDKIQKLSSELLEAIKDGDKLCCRHKWKALSNAINARSPAQIVLMERQLGLR